MGFARSLLLLFFVLILHAQSWQQMGQNPRHTGAVSFSAQTPQRILGQFTYDRLADQIRLDEGEDLLVHYMAPLVDNGDVFMMSRGASQWISCRSSTPPCGTGRWNQMEWGVTKLRRSLAVRPTAGQLKEQWTVISTWKPAPDNGSGWEPVFHPALSADYVYMPGGAGSVQKVGRSSGLIEAVIQPFDTTDPQRYVTSPLTIDEAGSIYYTVIRFDPAGPWNRDVPEAWLVKIDPSGASHKVSFSNLTIGAPATGCSTTFNGSALPWPPAPDAKTPTALCGSQRPGLNAAPAVARDGTIYVVSRAHFNSAYSYLIAVNADLTPKWSASLRDRLNDGCGVLLPPNGLLGGCRVGTTPGVDPATNELPAGTVNDLSTASPSIAPDGSILYGAFTRYNYARGHTLHFSSTGLFLGAYDFGWDITPGISEHDGTWSIIVKDNFYPIGSYCSSAAFCGEATPRYNITSLTPDLRPEWSFTNTNGPSGFEWCVNMVAIDSAGTVFANSEDGNVYAIGKAGNLLGRLFLKEAIGAAYTPLAIGADGLIYTQNDGTLFVVGANAVASQRPLSPRRD